MVPGGQPKASILERCVIVLLCGTAIVLIGMQLWWGWLLFGLSAAALVACPLQFRKDIVLLHISLGILALTKINTDISYAHIVEMAVPLLFAAGIPYVVSRFVYRDHLVRFRFHHGRSWYKTEIMYIFVTLVASYFVLPFYLKNTGAYLHWTVPPGASALIRFFVGTNALGMWDELFFISTVLGILRRYLSFFWANIAQAVLFTSFLYELGFTGWGFLMIYAFAIMQGYVFRKTDSLFYVITIHLSIDLILFLALVEAHHPDWMHIFVL
jgi:membrane protease YdiL (CAAX protease family)